MGIRTAQVFLIFLAFFDAAGAFAELPGRRRPADAPLGGEVETPDKDKAGVKSSALVDILRKLADRAYDVGGKAGSPENLESAGRGAGSALGAGPAGAQSPGSAVPPKAPPEPAPTPGAGPPGGGGFSPLGSASSPLGAFSAATGVAGAGAADLSRLSRLHSSMNAEAHSDRDRLTRERAALELELARSHRYLAGASPPERAEFRARPENYYTCALYKDRCSNHGDLVDNGSKLVKVYGKTEGELAGIEKFHETKARQNYSGALQARAHAAQLKTAARKLSEPAKAPGEAANAERSTVDQSLRASADTSPMEPRITEKTADPEDADFSIGGASAGQMSIGDPDVKELAVAAANNPAAKAAQMDRVMEKLDKVLASARGDAAEIERLRQLGERHGMSELAKLRTPEDFLELQERAAALAPAPTASKEERARARENIFGFNQKRDATEAENDRDSAANIRAPELEAGPFASGELDADEAALDKLLASVAAKAARDPAGAGASLFARNRRAIFKFYLKYYF